MGEHLPLSPTKRHELTVKACFRRLQVLLFPLQGQLEPQHSAQVSAPSLLTRAGDTQTYIGLGCGPGLTLAWSSQADLSLPHRAPFVIEICEQSFRSENRRYGL